MPRVLFSCAMDPDRRAALAAKAGGHFESVILADLPPDRAAAAWSEADVLVCDGFRPEVPDDLATRAPDLKLVQVLLAGVNQVPLDRIPPGVFLCSNAGAYTTSVAEHAMALLLAAAKDVNRFTEELRQGIFDQGRMGKALEGSTVAIAGMGAIGSEVARLCKAFRMQVIGLTRSGRVVPPADEGGTLADLPCVAARADYLVIALPLTRATEGLVDASVLGAMKEDAVLVNIARGKIVVEEDLYEHLKAHPRFRAALDVWWTYPAGKKGRPFTKPFHELPNMIMTPHNAFAIPVQRRRAMEAALDNVLRFLRGERPRNIVNVSEYDTDA